MGFLGFNSDYDYWRVEIQVEDNGPTFKSKGWKQCNLREGGTTMTAGTVLVS